MEAIASQPSLLRQKLELILRMRDLTASAEISGSRAEECYITLMSRREAIITQLRRLDAKLEAQAEEAGSDSLRGQISEASAQILEMDSELARRVPELMKGIKCHLKQLKNGRSINRAYHAGVFGAISEGSYNLRK